MNKTAYNGPPSPEELQRQLAEFVRQHVQGGHGFAGANESEAGGSAPNEESKLRPEEFEFRYKPREIKEYLDRFIIRQD
jgi:ATP-dependent Clp protease ATP-binding subunit ClpX